MMVNGSTYYMNRQANIISAYGWEKHSLFTDPLIISSSDYHLMAGSPAISTSIANPGNYQ